MTDNARKLVAQAYKTYKAGELDQARSLIRQALKLDPTNANAWYVAGLVSPNDKAKQQAFEKALSIDPQHKYARAALGAIRLSSEMTLAAESSAADASQESTPLEPAPSNERKRPTTPSTAKTSGWLLPTLVIVVVICFVAVIVMMMRSRSETLSQPTVVALAQSTSLPTVTESPTEAAYIFSTKTLPPTFTATNTRTKLATSAAASTKPVSTKLPTATVNSGLITITPMPTIASGAYTTGQFLINGNAGLFIVNADGSQQLNLLRASNEALARNPTIRTSQWSPDQKRILLTANFVMLIINNQGELLGRLDTPNLRVWLAVWSPDGNQIAFTAGKKSPGQGGDDALDIFVIKADGSDMRQITTDGRPYQSLDWSPDGRALLYTTSEKDSVGLWTISPDGGEPHLLASPKRPLDAIWSPDGKHILFRTYPTNPNSTHLFVIEADGSKLQGFPERGSIHSLLWSPDGTWIAYAVSEEDGHSIKGIPLTGGGSTILLRGLQVPYVLDWGTGHLDATPHVVSLPNADDAILFLNSNPLMLPNSVFQGNVYVLMADGQEHQVTNFAQYVEDPTWLPDGRIGFASVDYETLSSPGQYEHHPARIYVMNVDGSNLRQITSDEPKNEDADYGQRAPVWSPDGSYIAYIYEKGNDDYLHVMNADGSNDHEIGNFERIGERIYDLPERVTWSPDSRHLILVGKPTDLIYGTYMLDVDGSNLHLLTEFPGSQPTWSPDGKQIAFVRKLTTDPAKDDYAIYVMDAEGYNPHQISDTMYRRIYGLTWSPDSHHIVFSTHKETGATNLYLMNADGTDVIALTNKEQIDQGVVFPQWRPANKQTVQISTPQAATPIPPTPTEGLIAFTSKQKSGQTAICLAKPDGTAMRCALRQYNPTNLQWSPDGMQLVYVASVSSKTDIFVLGTDGHTKQLTHSEDWDFAPAWSPDSKHIAFISNSSAKAQILVMNADGSDQHVVTQIDIEGANETSPFLAWSPDGKTMVFTITVKGANSGIYVINADGSNRRKLTEMSGSDLRISPDGQKIVFRGSYDGLSSIIVMNADGSNIQPLTFSWTSYPAWSPDSQYIIFARDEKHTGTLHIMYIMRADGTYQHRLNTLQGTNFTWALAPEDFNLPETGWEETTPTPIAPTPIAPPDMKGLVAFTGDNGTGLCLAKVDGSARRCIDKTEAIGQLSWSPDGMRLAFSYGDGRDVGIYVLQANGTITRLTPENLSSGSPAWSPDSKQIVYVSHQNRLSQIFVMNADGTNQRQITQFSKAKIGVSASVAWSPDGETIVTNFAEEGLGIFAMDIDGSNQRKLSDRIGTSLRIAPDGQHIVFDQLVDNHFVAIVIDADGTHERILAESTYLFLYPSWSPDGRAIILGQENNRHIEIFIIGLDGSNLHQLNDFQGLYPVWALAPEDFMLPPEGLPK